MRHREKVIDLMNMSEQVTHSNTLAKTSNVSEATVVIDRYNNNQKPE